MRAIVLMAVTMGWASTASAADDVCAPTRTIDPLRLLRQTSLDLRGRIPSIDEYEAVRDAADPQAEAEARIEQMLASDDYLATIREYHRSLMWSSVVESILPRTFGRQLGIRRRGDVWNVGAKNAEYRGNGQLDCLDVEQTEFDADERPIPIDTFTGADCQGPDDTCRQEGWVWVDPYWDPATPIKVCAFDAQTFAESPLSGAACGLYHGNEPGCGCGPELSFCGPDEPELDILFRDALAEEPLRIFEWVIAEDRSYLDAFTTTTTLVNGPLAQYYGEIAGVDDEDRNNATAYDPAYVDIPALAFSDTTWVAAERDSSHAGVLTTMAYLVRFASNRSRANQFYTSFLCDPFVPPEDGLPAEEEDPNPNLRERDGCDGCHAVLEPAAAHWARWRTGGTYGLLRADVMSFEAPRPDCICGEGTDDRNCSAVCEEYYVTADNSHEDEFASFGGLPLAAAWLTDADHDSVEAGPRALVDSPAEQQQLAACTVRNLAMHLLGRELAADDLAWLATQTEAFANDGHRFTPLLRRLLADERYRSID
jgi:hypothetical protein